MGEIRAPVICDVSYFFGANPTKSLLFTVVKRKVEFDTV